MLLLFCTTIFGGEGASEAFKKMQALRAHHELEYAQAIGQLYLKIHPEDADVQLLMGLMALQEQDYTAAKQYLDKTLAIYPHYLDAQLGLIDLALIEKADAAMYAAKKQGKNNFKWWASLPPGSLTR